MIVLRYPVNYICITTYFEEGVHSGIDLGWGSHLGKNQPIYAACDGIVTKVKSDVLGNDTSSRTYGNYVEITHESGLKTFYAHLEYGSISVSVGDTVKMGQKIALMGDSGYAFGNHLHFEVNYNGSDVDPVLYTYAFEKQDVTSDPVYNKGILYYKEDNKDIETLREEISRLKKENEYLRDELNNYVFKYDVLKTGYYKIKLFDDEVLVIKKRTIVQD